MRDSQTITLFGRVFINGNIKAETGLHIGKGNVAVAIGDMDNPVVRDPLTARPYVPGSSLKGKMRSLLEKKQGKLQNKTIGKNVKIHVCDEAEYPNCDVGRIFGVPGELPFSGPTRLVVRDAFLSDASAENLRGKTDMPFTEAKWEVAIDRITSQATPRQIERVPAGAVFDKLELIYNIYDAADISGFGVLLEAMELLEDDYLGGSGSRGSGKVSFVDLSVSCKAKDSYATSTLYDDKPKKLGELLGERDKLRKWLDDSVPTSPPGAKK